MTVLRHRDHVILCGLNGLGLRTLECLVRSGEEVVAIHGRGETRFTAVAQALGARCIAGDYRDEAVLRAAGVPEASAVVLAEEDDMGNLSAALSAYELNRDLRIVLRMFNQQLASSIEKLFTDAAVLSASALAVPAFVAAALDEEHDPSFEVMGRALRAERRPTADPDVLVPLTVAEAGSARLFPRDGEAVCLVDVGPAGSRPQRTTRRGLGQWAVEAWMTLLALPRLAGSRLRYLAAALVALVAVSTWVFATFQHYDLVTALYFTVTTATTTGFGDINLKDAPWELKLYGISLMVMGATSLAVLYTLITDAIVSARLTRFQGRGASWLRGHVIVCGVGTVGFRVIERLATRNVRVAAAEIREDTRLQPMVRRLGVPLMIADTGLRETLVALNVAHARCVMAITDDDLTNLQTALNARDLNPSIRVVLRLFDPELARKVESVFGIAITRSVSALAAPALAAAALGHEVLATVAAGGHFFIVGRGCVGAASPAAGQSLAELESRMEARTIALATRGRTAWSPERQHRLAPGDEVVVVATRRGLVEFLAVTSLAPLAPDAPAARLAMRREE